MENISTPELITFSPRLASPAIYVESNFLLATHYDPEMLWKFAPFRTWWIASRLERRGERPSDMPKPAQVSKKHWEAIRRWEQGAACDYENLDQLMSAIGRPLTPDDLWTGWLIRKWPKMTPEREMRLMVRSEYVSAYFELKKALDVLYSEKRTQHVSLD